MGLNRLFRGLEFTNEKHYHTQQETKLDTIVITAACVLLKASKQDHPTLAERVPSNGGYTCMPSMYVRCGNTLMRTCRQGLHLKIRK